MNNLFRNAIRFVTVLSLAAALWWTVYDAAGQEANQKKVMTIRIEGEVQRGLSAYVGRVIDKASEENADVIIMRINTPGGRLDAALNIKDAMLNTNVPILALIDRQAYSAGALISIAAGEIYMVKGAVIGAATPITGTSGKKASEKMVSAVRKVFAATAEYHGRNPKIAEAMVDESIEIDGLVDKGKLLTLTAEEAKQWGYTDGLVKGFNDLRAQKNLTDATIIKTSPALAESLVGFFTSPVVASLLITIGMLGLLGEVLTSGWGVAGSVGLASLAIFFWGHLLAGLAGWEGIALVLLGIVFIALEVFVVPGFGIPGVLGLLCLLGGLFVSLIGDFTFATSDDYLQAGYILMGSIFLLIIGGGILVRFIPKTKGFGGLFLSTKLSPASDTTKKEPPKRKQQKSLRVGAIGSTITDLRPAGTAMFGDERADVVTEGQYVSAGTRVKLIQTEGNRLVVRPVEESGP